MRKWTTINLSAAERDIAPKPTDAERVKLKAKAFTRWVANRGRRADAESRPNGADR